MTDIEAMRADVVGHLRRAETPGAKLSAGGLMMLFNKIAPAQHRIESTSDVRMTIRLGEISPTARDMEFVLKQFGRAVAAIGHEIRKPSSDTFRLHPVDYAKAPLFTTMGADMIVVSAEAPGDTFGEAVERPSADAMESLVSLLPGGGASDDKALEHVLSARPPSRQAVRDVMEAATRARGLTVSLARGSTGELVATHEVIAATAHRFNEELTQEVTKVEVTPFHGVLDGGRLSRRIFYLTRTGAPEISGSISEAAVDRVFALQMGQPVVAMIQVKEARTRAGTRGKRVYELVDIAPEDALPEVFPEVDE